MSARRPRVSLTASVGGVPLVVSCEHASHAIPRALSGEFAGASHVVRSHCGWDPGALAVARRIARHFSVPLIAGRYSRLVIDLNRSLHHPRVFSQWTRGLTAERRRRLLELHASHWGKVSELLAAALADHGQVVHVAFHSFTGELDGEVRNAEVGLLYDPRREAERDLAARLRAHLEAPDCRVRRNYPYRGVADGLPTAMRRRFGPRYLGLELELNQAFIRERGVPEVSLRVCRALGGALG